MKNLLIVFALLFLLILGGAAVLLFMSGGGGNNFLLIKESGDVFFKRSGEQSYQTMVTDELELSSGSFVKTEEAKAHVILADNSVMSLDSNTEVQVEFTDTETTIKQLIGSTWHRVSKLSSDEEYQVETPSILAVVRGTKFGVDVAGADESDVFVVEDNVEVGEFEVKDGRKHFIDSETIGKDEQLSFAKGVKKRMKMSQKFRDSDWFKRNIDLDSDFDGIDRKQIRTKFREKLLARRKAVLERQQSIKNKLTDRFDASKPDEDDHTGPLKEKYVPGISGEQEVCKNVLSESYFEDLSDIEAQIEQDGGQSGFFQALYDYLSYLGEVCKDGNIDEGEMDTLKPYLDDVESFGNNQAGFSDKFEQEINAKLDYYVNIVPGAENTFCSHYEGKSVNSILNELTAIERKYGIQPQAASDFRVQVTRIKLACSDGVLSDSELDYIYSQEAGQ